jgi:hypothetical protein
MEKLPGRGSVVFDPNQHLAGLPLCSFRCVRTTIGSAAAVFALGVPDRPANSPHRAMLIWIKKQIP